MLMFLKIGQKIFLRTFKNVFKKPKLFKNIMEDSSYCTFIQSSGYTEGLVAGG